MSWTKHWIGLARSHKNLGDKSAGPPAKLRTGGNPIPAATVAFIKRDIASMTYQRVADLHGVSIHTVRNIAIGRTRDEVAAAPSESSDQKAA